MSNKQNDIIYDQMTDALNDKHGYLLHHLEKELEEYANELGDVTTITDLIKWLDKTMGGEWNITNNKLNYRRFLNENAN